MRAVIQRVLRAQVSVSGQAVGSVDRGLLVYVGIGHGDDAADAARLAEKVAFLRIFEDEAGKLNKSVQDIGGGVLAVPNFTLLADARQGRRPSFIAAASGEAAAGLFAAFVEAVRPLCPVASGVFGASMQIESVADGPINIVLDIEPAAKV